MDSSLSVDGSVSYVSNTKKICTSKIDDNVLNPDGELFMRLDTTLKLEIWIFAIIVSNTFMSKRILRVRSYSNMLKNREIFQKTNIDNKLKYLFLWNNYMYLVKL